MAWFLCMLGAASAGAASSVSLAWDPSLDGALSDYVVYYGLSPKIYSRSLSTSGTNTAITIPELRAGRRYYFTVRSRRWTGEESDPSNVVFYDVPADSQETTSLHISDIPITTAYGGFAPPEIPFTVFDDRGSATSLQVLATSSNPALIPNSLLTPDGTGNNRVLRISPPPRQDGATVVTLTVSDGVQTNFTSFELRILAEAPQLSPLSILHAGGSVSPDLDGLELRVGDSYTVEARPAPGVLFAGWSGAFTSSAPRLHFSMQPDLVLKAIFVPDTFPSVRGTYTGLFQSDQAGSQNAPGSIVLTTTAGGSYSGVIRAQGRSLRFSGRLDPYRHTSLQVNRAGTTPLTLDLSVGSGDRLDAVTGSVSADSVSMPLLAHRNVFLSKGNPAPFASRFTLLVSGQSDPSTGPEGEGYGALKVGLSGTATLAGRLADGTRISQQVALSQEGLWPVYLPLYGGRGWIEGWLKVTNAGSDAVTGALHWMRPALATSRSYPGGFALEPGVIGALYQPPLKATDPILTLHEGQLHFSGGDLEAPFDQPFVIGLKNRIASPAGKGLVMAINPASGLFSGTAVNPGSGARHAFRGAVLQGRNAGGGFSLGKTASAHVALGP